MILSLLLAAPFQVTVSVDQKTPSGLAPVRDGAALASGEKFQLRVTIDRAAFVYAVQFFADGTSALLYPKDHDVRTQPGVALRIPPEGYWFELDDSLGLENIYVIASDAPIDDADAKTAEVIQRVKAGTGGSESKPPKRPAEKKPRKTAPKTAIASAEETYPGGLTMRTRGIEIVADTPSDEVRVRSDDAGVAVVRFSFQHVAKGSK
jgi:hypothetical protein